ncbi:MAG: cob(I)yrinic acid a,c-diamide adenosyltransferase [Bacteroidetes bacterium]|nr:cob(I)yrinic acid a,c-diamide adenosyltransferase [Bacteroidota bacterium]
MLDKEQKIYTKKGDKGETSLVGGTRVPKFHDRIEAYGTVDELNSFVGLLKDQIGSDNQYYYILSKIQNELFIAESIIATEDSNLLKSLPALDKADVAFLENEMDLMNESLPILSNFILPSGHPFVSQAHVVRCVCRRAERAILKASVNNQIDEIIIQYFNRLSDYFFVLGRKFALDLKVPEIIWKTKV